LSDNIRILKDIYAEDGRLLAAIGWMAKVLNVTDTGIHVRITHNNATVFLHHGQHEYRKIVYGSLS
ncbi:MAG: hypothetical protein ACPG7F_21720, partial [Aggregatilineales bacterium]